MLGLHIEVSASDGGHNKLRVAQAADIPANARLAIAARTSFTPSEHVTSSGSKSCSTRPSRQVCKWAIPPTDNVELQIETGEVQSVATAELTHGNGVLGDERLATPLGEATPRHRQGDSERNQWFAIRPRPRRFGAQAERAASLGVELLRVSVSAPTQRGPSCPVRNG
jgi:hypothetical protein